MIVLGFTINQSCHTVFPNGSKSQNGFGTAYDWYELKECVLEMANQAFLGIPTFPFFRKVMKMKSHFEAFLWPFK